MVGDQSREPGTPRSIPYQASGTLRTPQDFEPWKICPKARNVAREQDESLDVQKNVAIDEDAAAVA
jgi:hypothetical protein